MVVADDVVFLAGRFMQRMDAGVAPMAVEVQADARRRRAGKLEQRVGCLHRNISRYGLGCRNGERRIDDVVFREIDLRRVDLAAGSFHRCRCRFDSDGNFSDSRYDQRIVDGLLIPIAFPRVRTRPHELHSRCQCGSGDTEIDSSVRELVHAIDHRRLRQLFSVYEQGVGIEIDIMQYDRAVSASALTKAVLIVNDLDAFRISGHDSGYRSLAFIRREQGDPI